MWLKLGAFLLAMTESLTARVLLSLGMGLASFASLGVLAQGFVTAIQNQYGQVDGVILAFLNLSGFSSGLTIMGSSLLTRAGMMALKKLRPI